MARQERPHQETDHANQGTMPDPLRALFRLLATAVASRLAQSDEEDASETKGQTTERPGAPRS